MVVGMVLNPTSVVVLNRRHVQGIQQGRSPLLGFRHVQLLVDGRELLVEGVRGLHLHGRQRLGVFLVDPAEHGHQAEHPAEFVLGVCTQSK